MEPKKKMVEHISPDGEKWSFEEGYTPDWNYCVYCGMYYDANDYNEILDDYCAYCSDKLFGPDSD